MKCLDCGNEKMRSACIGSRCISCWLETMCCCGHEPRRGNADCERCALLRRLNSVTKERDEYMKSLAESIGVDMESYALPAAHGNDPLRWSVLIAERLTVLGVFQPKTPVMQRPSTGHPAAAYRCGICGGLVHYDGTPPEPDCWPNSWRTNRKPKEETAPNGMQPGG